ncbi:hypothetical protein EJB05_57587, partial [Eragrostis curvula]
MVLIVVLLKSTSCFVVAIAVASSTFAAGVPTVSLTFAAAVPAASSRFILFALAAASSTVAAALPAASSRFKSQSVLFRISISRILKGVYSSEASSLPLQYLKEMTNNFSDNRLIGEVGFGNMYKPESFP